MDNEHNAPMQVDPSTNPMSALQAFKMDPSTEWVIKSVPGFVAIKYKMGCFICDALASHCMAAKRSYEICLAEKDVSHAAAEAWPELVRYQDDYYRLLEDYNALKETAHSAEKKAEERRAKINELYEKLNARRATIKNLGDQVQSLEAQLQEIKGNSDELPKNEELILKNKHLRQELDYYVGRARYALYGKDANWATHNGYRISDISASDSEDDDEDLGGLPAIPEGIPQNVPSCPPTKLACPVGKSNWNDSKVVHEAGIPAIGGSRLPPTPKRIIADPPTSITGVLPRPLGKSQAERWDQPALRGVSDWVMESDVHDSKMHRLYVEGRALQPHERFSDHTAVIFCIDEYAKSLPGLPRVLMVRPDDPDWMINVVQTFNMNPSGIPQNLRLESIHINVDNADVWYWLNLIKPKFHGAEAEVLLQSIFSTVGKWDQMIAGQWKRNDSPFLSFAYWLGCKAGVTPDLAQDKLKPYFVRRATKTIWNEVTLRSQLQANEIASLKGGLMNQFCIHDDLLPLMQENPYYFPPSVGEPMDQDESDPEPTLSQPPVGSSSLADRLDYGEGGSLACPPADAQELWARISYFGSLVPQGAISLQEDTIGKPGRPLTQAERNLVKIATYKNEAKSESNKLETKVELVEGMHVLITWNLSVPADLANGTQGTIERIWLDPRESLVSNKAYIHHLQYPPRLVYFRPDTPADFDLPSLPQGIIPIQPSQHGIMITDANSRKRKVQRQQFSMTPAYTFTDYRAQGQTLQPVIINLADPPLFRLTKFNAYVVISRGTSRDTLRILRDFDHSLFTTPLDPNLVQFDILLDKLDKETIEKYQNVL
ncbi:hypothetical protein M422DRAFT_241012 [Sphaerobolus stellatus SS14]|nr:hypothetical protein M422DRAFT_241012 [Sphaerobolus stellatus SS14]